jgi:hypothetical protein
MNCPRCGTDQPDGRTECSRCGVVFLKLARRPKARAEPARDAAVGARVAAGPVGFLLPVGRVLLLAALAVWSWRFFRRPLGELGDSALHLVNLPFHEVGHILFLPFGRFMTTIGGSLTQVLVPLVCVGALVVRARDPFGAAVCLWWCGQNFLDLAPYIDDARTLQLVLLGGRTGAEVQGHDWEEILTRLGLLHLDHAIARGARAVGLLLMIAALGWGIAVLTRTQRPSPSPSFGS